MSGAPSIKTRFTARYGVRHPLAQAGMAFAGWSPQLATAVSRAGGIGSLGAGLLPEEQVRGTRWRRARPNEPDPSASTSSPTSSTKRKRAPAPK